MTIEVEDGTASIASAEVVSGPCARLLIHSAGEAGVPTGYAAVQITYNGSTSIAPLCLVEVTSLKGDTIPVTTQPTITQYEQPCCPTGSCCSETSAISLHPHVIYNQPVVTVSFPAPPDGGPKDEDAAQPIEADAMDGESEIDAARETDAESIDAAGVDTTEDSLLLDGLLDDVAIDA
jgi:hypothetical protein